MEYSQGKWSSAAKNGLILASITIGVFLISSLLHSSSFIVDALLWIVKTAGSIWMLHRIMKEYSALKESISYGESFKYGFAVTLFSSLVISAYLFLSLTVIFPSEMEKVTEAMQMVMANGNYTTEEESAMERLMGRLPQYSVIVNIIYLSILGAIASAVIASFTKRTNPFEE